MVAKRTKAFFRNSSGVVVFNNETPASFLQKLSFRYLSPLCSQELDNVDGQLKKILSELNRELVFVTEKTIWVSRYS